MSMLNPKQQRFADEYIIDLNATQAAIRAGYSAKTAQEQGARLLSNVMVQAAIAQGMKERSDRTEITQDKVLKELSRIAFGNSRDVMAWGPKGVKLKDSDSLTLDEAAMVSEASESVTVAGGTLKLKTHDKVKALELIGKHLGMFKEKVELTGKDGGPIEQKTTVTNESQIKAAVSKLENEY